MVAVPLGGQSGGVQQGVPALQTTIGYTPPPTIDVSSSNSGISPEDFGAVADSPTTDNRLAFQRMFDAAKAAGGGLITIPPRTYYMTAAVTPGQGIKYSSTEYGNNSVWVRDAANITVRGSGPASRLVRTGLAANTVEDKYGQFFMFHNCSGIHVSGLTFVGMQNAVELEQGSGGGITLYRGTHDVSIRDCRFEDLGNGAGISLGSNQNGSGYDLAAPAYNVTIENIEVQNCRYFCFVGIAHSVRIRGWRHWRAPTTWLGAVQTDGYAQTHRSLYLQGCRDVSASGGRMTGIKKVGILLSAYPTSRALGPLQNINISDMIFVGDSANLEGEQHTAIRFDPQLSIVGEGTSYKNIDISGIQIRNYVNGIYYDDTGDTISATTDTMIDGLRLRGVSISASRAGILLDSTRVFKGMSFEQVSIDLFRANAPGNWDPTNGFRLQNTTAAAAGIGATTFHLPVVIHDMRIRAGNRAMQLLGCSSVLLSGLDVAYIADAVSGASTTDLRLEACGPVYGASVRLTGSGTNARVNMLTPAFLPFSITAGEQGVSIQNTGIITASNNTNYRIQWTLQNANGSVGTVGSLNSGMEFRCGIANGTSRLTDSAGTQLVTWGQTAGGVAAVSFFGSTVTAKAAITGSRAGNAALAALLTELAAKGLITDSSSA